MALQENSKLYSCLVELKKKEPEHIILIKDQTIIN
jgi:hypothetical protein